MFARLALIVAAAVLAGPRFASAQDQPPAAPPTAVETQQYDTPAYVSVVDGSATLERDGRIENAPLNMPLLGGDRLRTTDGRVEVRFADGGRLNLDTGTSLEILSDELVRLTEGRIRVTVQRAYQVNYRVDSAAGTAHIMQPGEYRVALVHAERETQLELSVIRGSAEIFTEQGTTLVRSGERANSSAGLIPSYAYAFNSASMDDFDRWSDMQRGTVYAASSESAQYLPSDMGGYASTFDQYGDWRYQQTYGYVWYPRVATDWRPYYYGRWASYPSYGWTWITADAFGYPTHHYGRWGFSAGAWFWIPSHSWGPAYVSWAYAPSYVSWCPLGWNNAAVFSIGYYNVGPAYYAGHYHGRYYAAWTTVPHGYFGHGYYAHQYAVNTWDRSGYTGARPRFTEGGVGPATRDVAVPRNTTPVRFAGTRATSAPGTVSAGRNAPASFDRGAVRSGARTPSETPRYVNRGDQIVRSQTERPTPPRSAGAPGAADGRDIAVARTPPQGVAPGAEAARRGDLRTSDHPDYRPNYRPAPSSGDSGYRAYDRAVPRMQDGMDRQAPQTIAPRNEQAATGMPRVYTRPYAGDRAYSSPSAGDRVYGQPAVGDRAYTRPSVGDRAVERPSFGRVEAPPASGRVAPAPPPMMAPPAAGRPMERAAPAPAPRSGGSGGERAAPRSGGGAPSGGSPRGGGRSR